MILYIVDYGLCSKCMQNELRRIIKCTINKQGEHHSFDDKPAIEFYSGTKYWYQNGQFHREDKPAIEWIDGDRNWYQNGQLHRTDGPALEHTNNHKDWWFLNGSWATSIIKDQEIIVGKSIEIDDKIGIVLRQIEGCFYEVLFGNKKVLIAKA